LDRSLIEACLMTLVWGGAPGARPAFLIQSNEEEVRDPEKGRGTGKTKLCKIMAALVGGSVDIRPSDDVQKIMGRLLSPEAASRRVALIDNIKSTRFSWDDLENLITANVLSGHRYFVGEGRRQNNLTWLMTLNGASL